MKIKALTQTGFVIYNGKSSKVPAARLAKILNELCLEVSDGAGIDGAELDYIVDGYSKKYILVYSSEELCYMAQYKTLTDLSLTLMNLIAYCDRCNNTDEEFSLVTFVEILEEEGVQ